MDLKKLWRNQPVLVGFIFGVIIIFFLVIGATAVTRRNNKKVKAPKASKAPTELTIKGGYIGAKFQIFPFKEKGDPETYIFYIGIVIPNCKDVLMLKVNPAVWAKLEENQPVVLNFTEQGVTLDDYSFELTPQHQEPIPEKKPKVLEIRKEANV